ncbi:MAG: hypothetical protein NT001_03340 [Candidatus Woesearchaeota archaeon]|nr:hypothetical protein [Candidatus Woesearchaeota archaeon]
MLTFMQNMGLVLLGIVLLLILRSVMKRTFSAETDIDRAYKKILISDEYKVKGRFD